MSYPMMYSQVPEERLPVAARELADELPVLTDADQQVLMEIQEAGEDGICQSDLLEMEFRVWDIEASVSRLQAFGLVILDVDTVTSAGELSDD